nr:DNA alkylation repair protein [Nocardioides sp.]
MNSDPALVEAIREALAAAGDAERAVQQQAYMKS